MKTLILPTRLLFYILAITCFSIGLISCKKESQHASLQHEDSAFTSAIQDAEYSKAASLLVRYFGGELTIENIERGPAGSIYIKAISNQDGSRRTLFMLPDQQHVIEGVLYSPHMTREQITNLHSSVSRSRAHLQSNLDASREEMRSTISSALKDGSSNADVVEATKRAITARVQQTSTAKREHNEVVAKSLVQQPELKTAALPRVNNVVDKENILNQIESADWISEGTGDKIVYVFYDLTCPACLEVHGHLQKYISSGAIEVRYLPVGALGPDALIRASLALMPSKNDSRLALLKLLSNNRPVSELLQDVPAAPETTQREGHAAALKNLNILVSTQRVATPTFAFRIKGVAHVSVLSSPQQLEDVIANIDEQ